MTSTGYDGEVDEDMAENANIYLKNTIDLNQLREGKEGVEFEVDFDRTNEEDEPSMGCKYRTNNYFDKEQVFRNMNFECVKNPESTENDNLSPFDRIAREMEDISGDGGVLKSVMSAGIGSVVPEDIHVRVHYNGYLENNEEPFDSSRLRGKPHSFKLGDHVVIPGWEIAIATMRKNETARFLVRPEYAYGKLGVPPRIPADARILFEIELLFFMERDAADKFMSLTEEEQAETPFEKVLEVSNTERTVGNDFYQNKQVTKAMNHYSKAQTLLEDVRLKDMTEEEKRNKILLRVYLNLAMCCLKIGYYGRTITYCDKSLVFDPSNVKALFRKGQALHKLSDFDKARSFLARAQKLSPNSEDITKELKELNKNIQKFRLMERSMYAGIFNTPRPDAGASANTGAGRNPGGGRGRVLAADDKENDGAAPIIKTPKCSLFFKENMDACLQQFAKEEVQSVDIPVTSFIQDEINYISSHADKLKLNWKLATKNDTIKILTLSKK